MAAEFDKLGIRFLYPENWVISEDEVASSPRSISLESPEGALWTLAIHPEASDPTELAESVLATLQAEEDYADFDIETIREDLAGFETIGYDVQFFCRHQVVSATIRALRRGTKTLLILCQCDDRDFERLAPVFTAITHSLLTSATWESPAGE